MSSVSFAEQLSSIITDKFDNVTNEQSIKLLAHDDDVSRITDAESKSSQSTKEDIPKLTFLTTEGSSVIETELCVSKKLQYFVVYDPVISFKGDRATDKTVECYFFAYSSLERKHLGPRTTFTNYSHPNGRGTVIFIYVSITTSYSNFRQTTSLLGRSTDVYTILGFIIDQSDQLKVIFVSGDLSKPFDQLAIFEDYLTNVIEKDDDSISKILTVVTDVIKDAEDCDMAIKQSCDIIIDKRKVGQIW